MRSPLLRRFLSLIPAVLLLALPASATWSIVAINVRTGEVGVASATCLENFNLKKWTPVVVVGVGGAAAQSIIDSNATNRRTIWQSYRQTDLTPTEILDLLRADASFQNRQYGIVAFEGAPVTFTGNRAGAAAFGVTGEIDDYVYAVQGNLLTADSVVLAAETAFREPGDMGQRLMAAMQAARALGGDGRCSCSPNRPTNCGAPPPNFTKSAHCGYTIVARMGDIDGVCNTNQGCASGTYYLALNIAGQNSSAGALDPVEQLQTRYDNWRANRVGEPDGLLSKVRAPRALPADGVTQRDVTVILHDLDGVRLQQGGATVSVTTRDGGPSIATVGPVVDNGDGSYSFTLTAGTTPGEDEFVITADGGFVRAATLYPYLAVRSDVVTPLHAGVDSLSAGCPTVAPFTLNEPAAAGETYLLVASLTGTTPGWSILGATLPLNPPLYSVLGGVPSGRLPGSLGVLDADGRAEAAFAGGSQYLTNLIGRRLDFAALLVGPGGVSATNAVGFDVGP